MTVNQMLGMGEVFVGRDPGHGGRDSGAVGRVNIDGKWVEIYEKNINLDISEKVGVLLTQHGVGSYATRTTDVALGDSEKTDLMKRCALINNAKCTCGVSFHCDGGSTTASHFGVYVYKLGGEAEKLAQKVIFYIQKTMGWSWGADDDGVREKNLALCRETHMPFVLVECNFITNPTIATQLSQEYNRQLLAGAITRGILEYNGILFDTLTPAVQLKNGTRVDGKIVDDKLWVPARVMFNAMGVKIEKWDNTTKTAYIDR